MLVSRLHPCFDSVYLFITHTWLEHVSQSVLCAVAAQLPSLCPSWWPCSPWPAWWVLAQWDFGSKLCYMVWSVWMRRWGPCGCWLCRVQCGLVYAYTPDRRASHIPRHVCTWEPLVTTTSGNAAFADFSVLFFLVPFPWHGTHKKKHPACST